MASPDPLDGFSAMWLRGARNIDAMVQGGRSDTSRPSRSKLGVEPLEFDAGVGGRKLPIGFGVMLVSMGLPSGDLSF
jgi:hypothetical protein